MIVDIKLSSSQTRIQYFLSDTFLLIVTMSDIRKF